MSPSKKKAKAVDGADDWSWPEPGVPLPPECKRPANVADALRRRIWEHDADPDHEDQDSIASAACEALGCLEAEDLATAVESLVANISPAEAEDPDFEGMEGDGPEEPDDDYSDIVEGMPDGPPQASFSGAEYCLQKAEEEALAAEGWEEDEEGWSTVVPEWEGALPKEFTTPDILAHGLFDLAARHRDKGRTWLADRTRDLARELRPLDVQAAADLLISRHRAFARTAWCWW